MQDMFPVSLLFLDSSEKNYDFHQYVVEKNHK